SSVAQINLIVDNVLASLLGERRVTWLYYSDRLMEFPLGVFGIALATVILPSLARNVTRQDTAVFSATLDWALRLVVLIALPATLGLALLAGPLVVTLFYGGAFNGFDVQMARASLWAFSGGLLAFIGVKVLVPGFFARQDMRTPVKIGLIALAVNFVLNLLFIWILMRLGSDATHAGLALATTCAAFVNAGLLFIVLRRRGFVQGLSGWPVFLCRIALATVALIGFLVWLTPALDWWLTTTVSSRVGWLALLVGGGAAVYAVVLVIAGLRPHHLRLATSA
ncbi:MAG: lipid II flippase MurJ, partial [Pseudomonadota bacterium]